MTKIKDLKKKLLWKPIGVREEFTDRKDRSFELVHFSKDSSTIKAWEKVDKKDGFQLMILLTIPASTLYIPELQRIGVWDLLSEDKRKEIAFLGDKKEVVEVAVVESSPKRGRKRNEEYAKVPRSVVCTKCGKEQSIAASQFIKRCTAKGITYKEFIDSFECLKCNPKQRGRKANLKWADLPKEFKCQHAGCKAICKQHPCQTEKSAELAGKKFQEFVDSWLCKEHRPFKPHHFSKEAREAKRLRKSTTHG